MSQSPVRLLSSMSKLPEAELQKRLESLKDPRTGKVRALSTLDAALVGSAGGMKQTTIDAYDAMQARAQTSHVIEQPTQAYTRGTPASGYAQGDDVKPTPQLGNLLAGAGKEAAKRAQSSGMLGGFDADTLKLPDMPEMQTEMDSDSRQMMFEQLKNQMNKISQAFQMMTNTLQAMHEQAMTAIRNAKA